MPDVTLIACCPVPDWPENSMPHEQIVTRATLYQMFDPDGSDWVFLCRACGNIFAPTPAEKEKIQRGSAQGSL
jgi:hypothetical protein